MAKLQSAWQVVSSWSTYCQRESNCGGKPSMFSPEQTRSLERSIENRGFYVEKTGFEEKCATTSLPEIGYNGSRLFFESPLHVPSFFVNDKPHNVGLNFIVLSNMLCLDANLVREDRLRGHRKSCSETRGPLVLIGASISIGPDLRNLFHFRLGFKSHESSQGPNRC